MIEIIDLTKKIGQTRILDNISLTVKKGEVLGFLGPNGAGKTTTMKIITSFWKPTSGQIKVDGLDVVDKSLETRRKIGYLPETVPLYDDMKVFEYLKFVAEIRGLEKNEVRDRIKDVVKTCGLQEVIRRPIEELSKGYRQRVGLAQAIIHQPEVLILDEPTTGLDPNQIAEIRELIKKIGQEKTVIFSTHILSEVSATCDRVAIINNGKIVKIGTPAELMTASDEQNIIYIKIKGEKNNVLDKLKGFDNISKVEIKSKETDNVYVYKIISTKGVDIRETLSLFITSAGFIIFEFYKKQTNLEDVFRALTE